jgi:uncharacterized protein (DUF1697 family)
MPVFISMLRGVNVGAHHRIKMDALRAVYISLKLEDPQTYVQSGNVIFRTKEKSSDQLAQKLQDAIDRKFKFRPEVILRSTAELKKAVAANPFGKRGDIEPGKLLLSFLAAEPAAEAQAMVDNLYQPHRVGLYLTGGELYIYFPDGAGKSKLPWSSLEKLFKVTGTARNWNSVTKMLEMAEALEAQSKL